MKCLYVYNPISGKGKAAKYAPHIVRKLRERFDEVDVYATKEAGDLERKAAEACGVYDVFVFAGGDGSFNEVVNGIAPHDTRPILGYIPTGTVNDIARSTGIKRNIRGALDIICHGGAYPLDVMRVGDRYAMYVTCSGGLTGCSYNAPQGAKKKFGKLAYAAEVLKHDLIFDEYPVTLHSARGDIHTHAVMVMIMNGQSVASFPVNGGGYLDDGKVEVLVVRGRPRKNETKIHRHTRYVFSVVRVFARGYRRIRKAKNIYSYEGAKFSVDAPDDLVWNFDGEKGVQGSIDVSVLPRHISVLLPPPQRGKRSCLSRGVDSVQTPCPHKGEQTSDEQKA